MNLNELEGPGTEYAVRQADYESMSRARLVAVETVTLGTRDDIPPKRRRYARMAIVEGRYKERARVTTKGEPVLVPGKDIVVRWDEHVACEQRRRERREGSERAKAEALAKFEELRGRVGALGLEVGSADAFDEKFDENALAHGVGRWAGSHLLVPVWMVEVLLEHAEAAIDVTARERAAVEQT